MTSPNREVKSGKQAHEKIFHIIVNRERQIKTGCSKLSLHISLEMDKINKILIFLTMLTHTQSNPEPHTSYQACRIVSLLWGKSPPGFKSKKPTYTLRFTMPLKLGICPSNMKTYVHKRHLSECWDRKWNKHRRERWHNVQKPSGSTV